ncbi:hypothetical protein [Acetobacter pasteurianus]|uniref:Tail fiber protein n=1 Tax=Acetobacter pasteurianus subsp. pasteurianus TaxID=481145 RepID=A0A1Y0YAT4_ACEPA|nr:hypothetical protein [Acetobacter pasteurianus]ARW49507.1 hypothetical protein S1001342_03217 [Acetobacter pasteurianus subsp. pasteurianus]
MELINTPDNKFVDADPRTLTAGTPIPASFMNAVQGEISNVVTGYGLTIDPTNDAQMKAALDKQFAPINSPSLTGIPLTTNPDGKTDNQIATVAFVKQYGTETSLGYQAVQQSGGTDQGSNKIYIGADSSDASQVRVQVDSSDIGRLVFQEDNSATYGVSKIGFNHVSDQFAFYNTGTKTWQFCYTTTQIDSKSYISSLPSGNNETVTNIIWNESSNLPAYYYGPNDTVTYSATTDWTNSNFLNLNGGTLKGHLMNTDWISAGAGGGWNGPRTKAGDYSWTNGIEAGNPYGTGGYRVSIKISDVYFDGAANTAGINFTGYDAAAKAYQWYFAWNGNITTPKGQVAFESDLTSYAQASELAAGTFDGSQGSTTSGRIVGGTWLRVGNTLTQNLVIENIGGGTVTYPIPFSGNDNQVTVIVQDGTGSNSTFTTGSITTTGTGIHASGGGGTGRMHLTVSGPYGT